MAAEVKLNRQQKRQQDTRKVNHNIFTKKYDTSKQREVALKNYLGAKEYGKFKLSDKKMKLAEKPVRDNSQDKYGFKRKKVVANDN